MSQAMGSKWALDDWLDYQINLHEKTIDLGLERIERVYQVLFPQGLAFKTIVVAGTNGKGSTCAFIEAIYQQSTIKTGKFSSPHILQYNERFNIDGIPVNDAKICRAFEQIENARGDTSLTYFEFSTLAALLIFAKETVDVAILEVGLGGRLDSVNVVDSDVSVITNIALDHCDYLGNTREAIGLEKAAVMRPNKPCLCADNNPPDSLINHGKKIQARLEFSHKPYQGKINLIGQHQRHNAALAVRVVQLLNKSLDKAEPCQQMIAQAIEKTKLQGRLQQTKINNKCLILDVAHNEAATQALSVELNQQKQPTIGIFSALKDKDIVAMIRTMRKCIDQWLLVPLNVDRGIDMVELSKQFTLNDNVGVCDDVQQALNLAINNKQHSRVVVFGSFYLIAEASKVLVKSSVDYAANNN